MNRLTSTLPRCTWWSNPGRMSWRREMCKTGKAHQAEGQSGVKTVGAQPKWMDTHFSGPQAGAHMPQNLSARQRRIIYRCKQRGWLEVDILLGNWAVQKVPQLQEAGLVNIENLLDADTPDVLAWILGHRAPPPAHATPVMDDIREFVTSDSG